METEAYFQYFVFLTVNIVKQYGHSNGMPLADSFGGSGICLMLFETSSAINVTYVVSEQPAIDCISRFSSLRLATYVVALVEAN